MTTVACNLKEIAADSHVTLEGVGQDSFKGEKLYVANGGIYGVSGEHCDGYIHAIEWLRNGAHPTNRPEPPKKSDWVLIELSEFGIATYNTLLERDPCYEPFMAIGSGRKVAMYCMKYLKLSPADAVREACRVDAWSKPPIFVADLKDLDVRRYKKKSK